MKKNIIEEAIANIAFTSEAIEKFCNDQNSGCSPYAAELLERTSWELHKQAAELEEINSLCCQENRIAEGELAVCCSGCMDCLGFSWKDFM